MHSRKERHVDDDDVSLLLLSLLISQRLPKNLDHLYLFTLDLLKRREKKTPLMISLDYLSKTYDKEISSIKNKNEKMQLSNIVSVRERRDQTTYFLEITFIVKSTRSCCLFLPHCRCLCLNERIKSISDPIE